MFAGCRRRIVRILRRPQYDTRTYQMPSMAKDALGCMLRLLSGIADIRHLHRPNRFGLEVPRFDDFRKPSILKTCKKSMAFARQKVRLGFSRVHM